MKKPLFHIITPLSLVAAASCKKEHSDPPTTGYWTKMRDSAWCTVGGVSLTIANKGYYHISGKSFTTALRIPGSMILSQTSGRSSMNFSVKTVFPDPFHNGHL